MADDAISAGFNDNHFEFRVNRGSDGFVSVITGFLTLKNMCVDTYISSLSVLEVESYRRKCNSGNFTDAILKMTSHK